MTLEHDPAPARGSMSFGDHLEELRRRLLLAIALPLPLAILAFAFAENIRDFLCAPAMAALKSHDLPAQLQVLSPMEALSTDMYLSMVAAVVASSPWILWQAWKFVEPGLYAHEKRFVRFLIPLSTLLTIAGFLLLYFVLMPLMLNVLVNFGIEAPEVVASSPAPAVAVRTDTGDGLSIPVLAQTPNHVAAGQMWLTPDHKLVIAAPRNRDGIELFTIPLTHATRLSQQFRLADYLDFTLMFILTTCIAFQAPLVVLLLGWIGLFDVKTLGKYRRYAVFFAMVLAAVISPGDPFSSFIMSVPLYLLYELGIVLLKIAPPQAVAQGEVAKRFARLFRGDR